MKKRTFNACALFSFLLLTHPCPEPAFAATDNGRCAQALDAGAQIEWVRKNSPYAYKELRLAADQPGPRTFFDEATERLLRQRRLLTDEGLVPDEVKRLLTESQSSLEELTGHIEWLKENRPETFDELLKAAAKDTKHFFFDESTEDALRERGLLGRNGLVPQAVRDLLNATP